MNDKNPWWWPQPINDEWRAQLRTDYPANTAKMSDDELNEEYGEGWLFSDTWDHLGDARDEYEKLAKAFLQIVEESGKKPEDFL